MNVFKKSFEFEIVLKIEYYFVFKMNECVTYPLVVVVFQFLTAILLFFKFFFFFFFLHGISVFLHVFTYTLSSSFPPCILLIPLPHQILIISFEGKAFKIPMTLSFSDPIAFPPLPLCLIYQLIFFLMTHSFILLFLFV
jgi:hypothetical protein